MQNNRQKLILRIGAGFAATLLLFPNFLVEFGDGGSMRGLGYAFIFAPPRHGFIHAAGLLAEFAGVIVICAALWWSESSSDQQ